MVSRGQHSISRTCFSSAKEVFASIQRPGRSLSFILDEVRSVEWRREMKSPVLALPPSITFLKPLKLKPCSPNLNSRISTAALQCYSSLKPDDHKLQISALVFLSALSLNGRSRRNVSLSGTREKACDFRVKAAAVPGTADDSAKPNNLVRTLKLGSMFAIWYLLNIYFNIYNKQVLKVFPFPATVSAFQFGSGTVLSLLMWGLNLYKKPKITRSQLGAILLLALGHTIGNLLTNISLGKVAVSFTHTIKAMEPFFTVVLSVLLLGEKPSIWLVSSLVPLVGGVALASFSEASFNWIGFGSAMASNLTNQSRNVFSKKVMIKEEESLDNINLFCVMTITSFIMMVPVAILLEGSKLSPSYFQYAASQGVNIKELCVRGLLAGFCFHSYQQVSYNILHQVSPVTHSVGNCLKRVVVIVSSIIFFQTPVSTINAFGTAMALAGVLLYSRAKRIKSTPKTA